MSRFITIVLANLVVVHAAYANGVGAPPVGGTGGIPGIEEPKKKLGDILADLSSFAIGLGITLATLMIVFAGYQILTAAGNTEKFQTGMKTITYAVAGLAVMLLSAVIINILKAIIGVP